MGTPTVAGIEPNRNYTYVYTCDIYLIYVYIFIDVKEVNGVSLQFNLKVEGFSWSGSSIKQE